MKYDVIIVGGGASGLMLASGLKVNNGLVLEGNESAGRKLLITGGGSCNITNSSDIKSFIDKYGDKGKNIRKMIYKYNNKKLIEHFESLGVKLMEREDKKVFPKSMDANEIKDALIKKGEENGFEFSYGQRVIDVNRGEVITDKERYEAEAIVLATGGKSYPNTGSDGFLAEVLRCKGIDVIRERPALTPVYVENYEFGEVSGISLKNVKLTLGKKTTTGDVLLTHRGFSGPSVLRLSEYAKPGEKMYISLINENEKLPKGIMKTMVNYIADEYQIPKNFLRTALGDAADKKMADVSKSEFNKLKRMEFTVSGTGGFGQAMVTKGGISLNEVDMDTLELKKMKSVYAIGELLDVNGDTGGYNMQFCYSSAMTAANAIDKG